MAVTASLTINRIGLGLNKTLVLALLDGTTWRIAQVSIPQTVIDEAAHMQQNYSLDALWSSGTVPDAEQQRYIESRQTLTDFTTIEGLAKTFYNGLTGPQKVTVVNSLTNWGAATATQKADALLACVALLFVAVGYLIRLQIKE